MDCIFFEWKGWTAVTAILMVIQILTVIPLLYQIIYTRKKDYGVYNPKLKITSGFTLAIPNNVKELIKKSKLNLEDTVEALCYIEIVNIGITDVFIENCSFKFHSSGWVMDKGADSIKPGQKMTYSAIIPNIEIYKKAFNYEDIPSNSNVYIVVKTPTKEFKQNTNLTFKEFVDDIELWLKKKKS